MSDAQFRDDMEAARRRELSPEVLAEFVANKGPATAAQIATLARSYGERSSSQRYTKQIIAILQELLAALPKRPPRP